MILRSLNRAEHNDYSLIENYLNASPFGRPDVKILSSRVQAPPAKYFLWIR